MDHNNNDGDRSRLLSQRKETDAVRNERMIPPHSAGYGSSSAGYGSSSGGSNKWTSSETESRDSMIRHVESNNEGEENDDVDDWDIIAKSNLTTNEKDELLPVFTIVAILSTAFSYGCVLTTLFLITLPIECERINVSAGNTPKSVALGIFVAIAGITQLISPLVGRLSDSYEPPHLPNGTCADLGQRLPYFNAGGVLAVTGLFGQMLSSDAKLWIRYGFCFFFSLTGFNVQYAMMLALIPDQVPRSQTGVANGILAFLLVTGSLFGFGLFHTLLAETISSMYGLYTCIVVVTSILTSTHAHERDAKLTADRVQRTTVVGDNATRRMDDEEGSQSSSASHTNNSKPFDHHRHPKNWPKNAHRVTRKVVKKAVKTAQHFVLTPAVILDSMFRSMSWATFFSCYTIDTVKYYDFYIVSISRLFYYCGMSVQTFFLYFVHDIIHIRTNPQAAVATLAILGQFSATLTTYPAGVISDRFLGGRRTPFVYVSCAVLSIATLTLIFATTFHQMVVVCVILGAANGVYLTMDTSLAVDTLPKDFGENDSGSGQLLGFWGVTSFVGSALGPMIGGPLLYFFGSTSSSKSADTDDSLPDEYSLRGYVVVLSLSAFYFACSALTLRLIKDHDK
jgi:MFS family permease